MIGSLHRGLNAAGKRQDLVVVLLLVTAILMMILPLPTWLVDILIAVNLAAAVLLLMMALYLKKPLDFSTLPSVILIITIFRLALSITTTRLILLDADAGQIIETFGQFVIAGELIVGLVVFLIITIVQFVVITKGSERVAEVSARFTLDALPGKQMSIDSDLRNGDIDQGEARHRRRIIEQESQFFGAMDGAMKFVKGDAIAGLVIVAVNLIGGIAIGMTSHGMTAGQAVDVYSLLTVGDGLAAQLPALFVSLAAGSVITRVATDENVNLGADITREMISSTLALRVASVILLVMMFVPGFPWPVFLVLSACMLAVSFSDSIRTMIFGGEEEEEAGGDADIVDVLGLEKSPFILRIAPGILDEDERARFAAEAQEATHALSARLGIGILPPRLLEEPSLPEGGARIDLDDVAVATFQLRPGALAVETDAETLTMIDVPGEVAASQPPGFGALHWIDPANAAALEEQGSPAADSFQILRRAAEATQTRYAAQCIGMQEARAALASMAQHFPDLVSEVRDLLPLTKVAEVFRRLVDEDVPIRNQRLLLEALTEWGAKEQDPVVLTEYVRTALKRQICNSIADSDRVIPVYLLDGDVEETIRNAIRQTTVGEYLALDDSVSASLVETVRQTVREPLDRDARPAILASLDVRRFVRSLLSNNRLRDIAVLSYQDLSNEFTVTPVTTILLPGGMTRSAAEQKARDFGGCPDDEHVSFQHNCVMLLWGVEVMRATISGGAGGGGVRQSAFSGFEKAANTASKAGSGTAQASSGGRAGLKPTAPAWKADAQTRASLDQLVSQLSALLESLTRLLNGVLETQVAGGGAADRSRPSTDAGQPLRRLFPSTYEDGKSTPSGSDRPGAREISNAVSATTGDRDNRAGASDLFWLWGQFLDHDIDLSHTGDETLPIGIPKGDATFDPEGTGDAHLDFSRSSSTQNALGVRQQINEITALIDGSNIYGSSDAETAYLRSFEGGRLRMSDDASLPIDARGFYVAGDARANENIGLTAMHTLFAREHNRIADLLAAENPCWSDEQLFAEARRWVTAELQSITVNEFLPILLGEGAVGAYGGYQSGLDAQASNAFAAAAYRFGHSMVSDDLTLMNADGTVSEIPLRDAFFRPDTFHSVGPDAIFRGLASNTAQAVDPEIVDSLRNFVMDAPGSPRLDLAALNIQRGRDHGLPTLNDARAALGMRRIGSFDDPAFREGAGARLAQVYDSVDEVDLWVGLLAEAPTGSGLVGPTQSAILGDQFSRLRHGDPDWYENTFTPSQVMAMNQTRLSDIIARNTGVTGLQADAMLASAPAYA